MGTVIDAALRGAKREVENVRAFLTTPMGPFEAIDKVVRDARSTGREIVETVGMRIPTLRGQRKLLR